MDNLENELKKTLKNEIGFDHNKNQAQRKETKQMFYDKMRNVKIVTWICLVICGAIMLAGMKGMSLNTGKYVNHALFMALVGFNSTILIKLWCWQMYTKIGIIKEIKQLQLQIAELAEPKSKTEDQPVS